VIASLGLRCAIDVSDGVASEAWHLARASGVSIRLDTDLLPLAAEAVSMFGEAKARQLAISGGEDYQLLFTAPETRLAEVAAALGAEDAPTVVGRVVGLRERGDVELIPANPALASGRPGYVAF